MESAGTNTKNVDYFLISYHYAMLVGTDHALLLSKSHLKKSHFPGLLKGDFVSSEESC